MSEKIHHGRNIKRFREMMGIKQEALAFELGPEWSQKKISQLEQKEEVEEELLRQRLQQGEGRLRQDQFQEEQQPILMQLLMQQLAERQAGMELDQVRKEQVEQEILMQKLTEEFMRKRQQGQGPQAPDFMTPELQGGMGVFQQ